MSPLIRLTLPILFGMIAANFSFDILKWDNPFIFISFAIASITTAYIHYKHISTRYFSLAIHISFALFGFIIALHSISKAQEKYGDKWEHSVYTDNPLRLQCAEPLRQSILRWYGNHGVQGPEAGIVEAMTIGEKRGLTKETRDNFSKAGVSHIIALSGFHVGLIYMILQVVFLGRIGIIRWHRASSILTLIALWLYAFVSGMSPSLVRAVIMCTVLTIASLRCHQILSFHSLCLAALITLLLHPLVLRHVGFQLSYMSMAGIYFIGIPLIDSYRSYTILDKFVWSTISITIGSILFTMPIISYTFDNITLMALPSNLAITILTYLLFLLFFVWLCSLGHHTLATGMLAITAVIDATARIVAEMSASHIELKFNILGAILYYAFMVALCITMRRRKWLPDASSTPF